MEMNNLKLCKNELEQFTSILKDWIPKDASIAIAVDHAYIYSWKSNHHLHLESRSDFDDESIAAKVLRTSRKIENALDDSLFGEPYPVIGYPIYVDEKKAALIIILPTSFIDKRNPYKFLTGKQDECWTPVPIDQISYIESLQKRTWFYADSEQYKSNITLKELQTRLPNHYIRIHRSYILNIYYVKKIKKDISSNFIVVLKNNIELPVSQTYVNELRKIFEF
ncbi:LytTR family DNA-binding domain-containing protein [Ureibacillus acetophenoni]|uniref:LytTr DNA-binding domain-containing protein n=1 Tax=Ureibacillus acetophenoni TaxID=614649 RepID=A0A285UL94_9BACL|nr:LytTR family DNA-binding domain-containing protein [Ureibacillus acetophenoni]SOC42457.1 LytTr DNA-binding domain-containing protein [Ureibacillus acetophenoni]